MQRFMFAVAIAGSFCEKCAAEIACTLSLELKTTFLLKIFTYSVVLFETANEKTESHCSQMATKVNAQWNRLLYIRIMGKCIVCTLHANSLIHYVGGGGGGDGVVAVFFIRQDFQFHWTIVGRASAYIWLYEYQFNWIKSFSTFFASSNPSSCKWNFTHSWIPICRFRINVSK